MSIFMIIRTFLQFMFDNGKNMIQGKKLNL